MQARHDEWRGRGERSRGASASGPRNDDLSPQRQTSKSLVLSVHHDCWLNLIFSRCPFCRDWWRRLLCRQRMLSLFFAATLKKSCMFQPDRPRLKRYQNSSHLFVSLSLCLFVSLSLCLSVSLSLSYSLLLSLTLSYSLLRSLSLNLSLALLQTTHVPLEPHRGVDGAARHRWSWWQAVFFRRRDFRAPIIEPKCELRSAPHFSTSSCGVTSHASPLHREQLLLTTEIPRLRLSPSGATLARRTGKNTLRNELAPNCGSFFGLVASCEGHRDRVPAAQQKLTHTRTETHKVVLRTLCRYMSVAPEQVPQLSRSEFTWMMGSSFPVLLRNMSFGHLRAFDGQTRRHQGTSSYKMNPSRHNGKCNDKKQFHSQNLCPCFFFVSKNTALQ